VSTYGAIALALGLGSGRSVGTALKCNPFAPMVPCHRVVRGDLSLGGFNGATDPNSAFVSEKLRLLTAEGVRCVKNGTAEARIADRTFLADLSACKLRSAELHEDELVRD